MRLLWRTPTHPYNPGCMIFLGLCRQCGPHGIFLLLFFLELTLVANITGSMWGQTWQQLVWTTSPRNNPSLLILTLLGFPVFCLPSSFSTSASGSACQDHHLLIAEFFSFFMLTWFASAMGPGLQERDLAATLVMPGTYINQNVVRRGFKSKSISFFCIPRGLSCASCFSA